MRRITIPITNSLEKKKKINAEKEGGGIVYSTRFEFLPVFSLA